MEIIEKLPDDEKQFMKEFLDDFLNVSEDLEWLRFQNSKDKK